MAAALPPNSSDHSPIILWPKPKSTNGHTFKYEAIWEENEEVAEIIKDGWKRDESVCNPAQTFLKRASSCRPALHNWYKRTFKDVDSQIANLNIDLQRILNQRKLHEELNETLVALVPKIQNNLVIAQEVFHKLNQRTWPGKCYTAIKLDLSKAYDRLDWSYLNHILLAYGFSQTWVDRVMSLVSTVSYRYRIDGWKERLLNQAGKEVLIKVVLQAIPAYAMATIRFPKKICDQLCSQIAKFWWSSNGRNRGMHWKCCGFLTKCKGDGDSPQSPPSELRSILIEDSINGVRRPDSQFPASEVSEHPSNPIHSQWPLPLLQDAAQD
ncbi:hypothetical protein SESBI_20960 [Sesbania bispinosa]|nr:hypothetical protein SESBI_20960 [Sesbania bispinosa]